MCTEFLPLVATAARVVATATRSGPRARPEQTIKKNKKIKNPQWAIIAWPQSNLYTDILEPAPLNFH